MKRYQWQIAAAARSQSLARPLSSKCKWPPKCSYHSYSPPPPLPLPTLPQYRPNPNPILVPTHIPLIIPHPCQAPPTSMCQSLDSSHVYTINFLILCLITQIKSMYVCMWWIMWTLDSDEKSLSRILLNTAEYCSQLLTQLGCDEYQPHNLLEWVIGFSFFPTTYYFGPKLWSSDETICIYMTLNFN